MGYGSVELALLVEFDPKDCLKWSWVSELVAREAVIASASQREESQFW